MVTEVENTPVQEFKHAGLVEENQDGIGYTQFLKLQLKNTHLNSILKLMIELREGHKSGEIEFDEPNLKLIDLLIIDCNALLIKGEITRKKMNIDRSSNYVVPSMFRLNKVVFMYNMIQTALGDNLIEGIARKACLSEAGMHIAKILDDFNKEVAPTDIK